MICQVCKQEHPLKIGDKWCDRSDMEIENDRLKAENARYRKALEFYADYKNWMKSLSDVHYSPAEISLDCGLRAKEALKEIE